jgi:hypothetical protein
MDLSTSAFFTANAELSDGTTPNYTQKVTWVSTNTAVATISNAAGTRGQVTAVSPGTSTIKATDPVSGVSSTDSGEDATVTVVGPLESIAVSPVTITKVVGEFVVFTATGHYQGGGTKNLTQQVDWASSNEAVAIAPNDPGGPNGKSRVDALAAGTSTISATDPATQIVGNASLTVRTPSATRTPTPTPSATP